MTDAGVSKGTGPGAWVTISDPDAEGGFVPPCPGGAHDQAAGPTGTISVIGACLGSTVAGIGEETGACDGGARAISPAATKFGAA